MDNFKNLKPRFNCKNLKIQITIYYCRQNIVNHTDITPKIPFIKL